MISKKALIVNSIQRSNNASTMVRVPYYADAELTKKIGEFTLYEIYFIMDHKKVNNKDVVLLSKSQEIIEKINSEDIVGWVDNNRFVQSWNTRLAIEPIGNSNIYPYWDSRLRDRLPQPIKVEPKSYSEMRYPYISQVRGGHHKINYMNNEGEFSLFRQTLAKAQKQDKASIIILVDATAGMRDPIDYIGNIKKALNNFLDNTNKDNMVVAVAVYRDTIDDSAYGYRVSYELVTGGFVKPNQALNYIDKIRGFSSNNDTASNAGKERSKLESLYYGINKVLNDERLNLDKISLTTPLILIGDHGDHGQDGISSEVIKKSLENKRVELLALRVHDEVGLERYSNIFNQQIRELLRKNKQGGNLTEDSQGSPDSIESFLKQSVNNFIDQKGLVRKLVNNQTSNFSQKDIDIMNKLGIDVETLGIGQQCMTLFIKSDEHFDKYILSDNDLIGDLSNQFSRLARSMRKWKQGSKKSKDKLEETLLEFTEVLTGQEIDKRTSLDKFIKNRVAIPLKSEFFKKDIPELINKIDTDKEFRKRTIKSLFRSSEILNAMRNELAINWEEMRYNKKNSKWINVIKEDAHGNQLKEQTLFDISIPVNDRQKKAKDGDSWLWIPVKYLP
jgi:hypothetical protein